MKLDRYLSTSSNLFGENRLLKFVVLALGCATVLNTCGMMRAQQMEKVVIVPTTVTEKMWIAGDQASEEYIKQFVRDAAGLYLTFHPANVRQNFSELLKLYHPTEFGAARKSLYDLADRIEESKASSAFYLTKLLNDEKKHQLEITGVKTMIISEKVTEQAVRNYVLEYKIESGKFSIVRFMEKTAYEKAKTEENNEKK
ncbi:hypothetical protein A2G06_16595 (plasmid) [Geobacter anodireducens]|nr:hypothetical protein A2G06_16595 [Geobacter anodireducens]